MNKPNLLIVVLLVAAFFPFYPQARAQQIDLSQVPHGMRGQPPSDDYQNIVDQFGQYAKADWPGKLHHSTEFVGRLAVETQDLKQHPVPTQRDRFGGWSAGSQLPRPKYFQTTFYHHKWWLVDPEGHLFFSVGMDSVRPDEPTIISGRETLFSWLPSQTDPLSRFYGQFDHVLYGPVKAGKTFDFYSANLYRKYGVDYLRRWTALAPQRLLSWGFNTFGNWNDLFYANGKVPYTVALAVGGSHARLSSGLDYWGKMHDPFDPQFAVDVQKMVQSIPQQVIDDPYCIGYFVDNELSWGAPGGLPRMHYGLAYSALAQNVAASPAKNVFIEMLQAKYGDISKINLAWGTHFAAWEELKKPYAAPDYPNTAMQADFSAFLTAHAQKYFQVIHDALKKTDPNHLYLGCRFALSGRTPEAVAAAAHYCDVVSFNAYLSSISPALDFATALNKPCIIGEFHFGALDRGMFHPGLVKADDQTQRARMFKSYMDSVLQNPAFVGCHWFKWCDEPLTGRPLDGENYNIGFVSVTDTPYPEIVAASREEAEKMYRERSAPF